MIFPLLALAVFVGNESCRPCHKAIVESYEKAPMARSTGPAVSVPMGSFRHAPSGIEYRIAADGRVMMRDRSGHTTEEKFDYVVGSGAAGFSFLIARDRFLWQAPVTWYAQTKRWAPSPGYEQDPTMLWDRPVDQSCLSCHASQLTHIYGTNNRYADPPFRQNGVGCERCHGPGSEHIKGQARMVRPGGLTPERRDDVCRQCHLMGEARVPRPGKSFGEYRAGDRLGDYVAYFVYDDPAGSTLRSTSHFEKFIESRCRIASGDKMWCGTCHDVHTTPADPVSFYREKCATCHSVSKANASTCPRTANCIGCHMPKLAAVDAGHGAFTDHAIRRRPAPAKERTPGTWKLRPFSAADAGNRELAGAYVEVFRRTSNTKQRDEALRIISQGER